MTPDDVFRWSQEARVVSGSEPVNITALQRFAKLVAAAEREACAKTCEEKKSKYDERVSKSEDERDIDPEVARIAKMTCDFNAAAIRARGKV